MKFLMTTTLFLLASCVAFAQDVPSPSLKPGAPLDKFIDNIKKNPPTQKRGDRIVSIGKDLTKPRYTIENSGWRLSVEYQLKGSRVVGVRQVVTSPEDFEPTSTTKLLWDGKILKQISEVGPQEGQIPGYNIVEEYHLGKEPTVDVTATVQDGRNTPVKASFVAREGAWVVQSP